MTITAPDKRGFGLNRFGTICPLNPEADYMFYLGLDDDEKFVTNQKSELQLLAEAFGLEYEMDEYILELTNEAKDLHGTPSFVPVGSIATTITDELCVARVERKKQNVLWLLTQCQRHAGSHVAQAKLEIINDCR